MRRVGAHPRSEAVSKRSTQDSGSPHRRGRLFGATASTRGAVRMPHARATSPRPGPRTKPRGWATGRLAPNYSSRVVVAVTPSKAARAHAAGAESFGRAVGAEVVPSQPLLQYDLPHRAPYDAVTLAHLGLGWVAATPLAHGVVKRDPSRTRSWPWCTSFVCVPYAVSGHRGAFVRAQRYGPRGAA